MIAVVAIQVGGIFPQMHVHFPTVAQAAFAGEMFDERTCLRIKSYIGILFAQERTGTLVHTEQYYGIIFSQNVVLHNFVFPLRVVMIKKCFRLFVFKELQWHEGKGHIEFEDGSPNKEIKGKADYKSQIEYYVGLFDKETARLAKEKEEAEKAAEEFYNSEEQRWVRLRTKRNELIAETDYLMMEDYPITDECRAAFEGYRQALRDITSQDGAPWTDDTIPWPAKPEIVKKEAA